MTHDRGCPILALNGYSKDVSGLIYNQTLEDFLVRHPELIQICLNCNEETCYYERQRTEQVRMTKRLLKVA